MGTRGEWRAGWAGVLLLAACAPPEPSSGELTRRSEAILGGTLDPTDTDVFLLDLHLDGARTALCSSTLVSPHVLLTAAHCVDPASHGSTTLTARAMNKPDDTMLMTSDFIDATDIKRHPNWSAGATNSPYDVAVVLLAAAPSNATPRQLQRAAPVSGHALRVVGYGRTSSSVADSGTRRSAAVSISAVSASHIDFGNTGSLGTCVGDSGGPAFYTGSDGVERVAGVHSYGAPQCGSGSDVRVDSVVAFIDAYLDQKDPALCTQDGRCHVGCAPADPDCVCVADGTCNPQCPNLLDDPDCPRDCVTNGVCAQTCPVPDADCSLDGDLCTSAAECLTNVCLSDPRGFSFCSRACTTTADCTRDMTCQAGQCRAPSSATTSSVGVKGSCSAVPGLDVVAVLAVALRCRRRR